MATSPQLKPLQWPQLLHPANLTRSLTRDSLALRACLEAYKLRAKAEMPGPALHEEHPGVLQAHEPHRASMHIQAQARKHSP